MSILQQVQAARSGKEPALICQVPSGWVVLCVLQFLRGYSILMPDPVVSSLNDLDFSQRAQYLCDMALVGDALLEVTGAYRINYAVMGNSDPVLHAHIVPRYRDEPDKLRSGPPWAYPDELVEFTKFEVQRDQALMQKIASAIQARCRQSP
jgi:diadenosine tetraphosphate (Ap4A) HIT family hydrolase